MNERMNATVAREVIMASGVVWAVHENPESWGVTFGWNEGDVPVGREVRVWADTKDLALVAAVGALQSLGLVEHGEDEAHFSGIIMPQPHGPMTVYVNPDGSL